MNFEDAQQQLNKRFRYRSDKTGEKWTILDMDGEGEVYGDCEDYTLSLIFMAEDQSYLKFWWSLLTLKYSMWGGKTPSGELHAFMWVRGKGWTDNIVKDIRTRSELKAMGYKFWWPIIPPIILAHFALRPVFYLLK
jgi:predicted transglutaminase-like cysteine proteinase